MVARHEMEQILCYYGRMDRLQLYTRDRKISPAAQRRIDRAVQKRRLGVPLGYILGLAPFYGRDFLVNPDVLIPRPETERLVEETLKVLHGALRGKKASVLDLGTGSGCIAASLTLEGPPCRMAALDVSKKALAVARKNFKRLGLGKKIKVVESALFGRYSGKRALWDVIVSNPPYIPRRDRRSLPREVLKEPALALFGGADGLSVLEALLEAAPRYLKPGGWLLAEIGAGQSKKLSKWRRRYASLVFEKDLNGIERILVAQANG